MSTNTGPQIMGIININNESFYKSSRCLKLTDIETRIEKMINEGADLLDIGACSTRPGSTPISMEQEWAYLQEPLKFIAKKYPAGTPAALNLSLDTYHAEIVKRAYDLLGKFTINDISAGEGDEQMLETAGRLQLTYIAMHKRGTPDTMQQLCDYPDGVVEEVVRYFTEFQRRAARYGVTDYILDPGFGFAKTIEQNYQLFNGLPQVKQAVSAATGKNCRLLVGISRKTMIWKLLGITPDESLGGTMALHLQALLAGADILRVHDVKEGVQCRTLCRALLDKPAHRVG